MSARTLAAETGRRLAEAAPLNATLHWSQDVLDREADRLDAAPAGPLSGMAIAIKDNIVTTEEPTTCASKILAGYTSPYEATVITRLRAAGALVGAKANLDEFAMGSSTENSAYGRVLHPIDHDRVPGGSSGGSACVVASRGSCPDIAARTRAASFTVLPKTEMQSSDEPNATRPKRETRP